MKIRLGDQELADINAAFRWLMRQTDEAGRSVGGGQPFRLVDDRVQLLLQKMSLHGLRVLEPGCLEGQVTIALCAAGARVTAFDARPTCLLKTFARCLAFGFEPRLLWHDARRMHELGTFDVICHFGVFYHLADPVAHLRAIANCAPLLLLDTHTARPDQPPAVLAGYSGMWYTEHGWQDEQSGLEQRSFWLTKADLRRLFSDVGFTYEVLSDKDDAPNGPRSLFLLRRE